VGLDRRQGRLEFLARSYETATTERMSEVSASRRFAFEALAAKGPAMFGVRRKRSADPALATGPHLAYIPLATTDNPRGHG
jgi:hypothetical protein